MAHLFISYASADQAIATEVCALLEARGVSCWIAPRDVAAGAKWDEALLHAIDEAGAFLLLLSTSSNDSPFVQNEVNRAFSKKKPIFTFRIEDVAPAGSLEFYLARHHWTDGFGERIEPQVDQLAASVMSLVGSAAAVPSGVAMSTRVKRAAPARFTTRATRRERLAWTSATALAIVVGLLMMPAVRGWRAPAPLATYVSIDAPPDTVLGESDLTTTLPTRTPIVFTPDGRSLVIEAARNGRPQLYLRSLERPDANAIAGTDDARSPFISPDGKWVGFWAGNQLRKVPIEGGTPTTIWSGVPGALLGPNGAVWTPDEVIVFSHPVSGQLMRVSANGGTPAALTDPPRITSRYHVSPFFVKQAAGVLFSDVSNDDAADSRLMFQPLAGGVPRKVLDAATDGRVLPSGRLAFMRLGTLMTVGFDASRAEVTGEAVPAMNGVMESGLRGRVGAVPGAGMYAVSSDGTLALIHGTVTGGRPNSIVLAGVGNSAVVEPAAGSPIGSRIPARFAPDQNRIAVSLVTPIRRELWIIDRARSLWTECKECAGSRLTRGTFAWSPDGRQLLTSSFDSLYVNTLDGSAKARLILREPKRSLAVIQWLKDGRIVYGSSSDGFTNEVKVLERDGQTGRVLLPGGIVADADADVSPDGRWVAFSAGDSRNIFVQALSASGGRVQVSAIAGRNPMWSADGRTVYYSQQSGPPEDSKQAMVAVPVSGGDVPLIGVPRTALDLSEPQACAPVRCYDVTADGTRFLIRQLSSPVPPVDRIDLVLNWTTTLPK